MPRVILLDPLVIQPMSAEEGEDTCT